MIMKWLCCYVFICGSLFSFISIAHAENINHVTSSTTIENDPEMNCTKNIKLSDAQKKRLDAAYNRIYNDYVKLIETYGGLGALPEDQIIVRYKMLNNYIKTFYKRGYRWCSEHETDEWEEEWYNNDED